MRQLEESELAAFRDQEEELYKQSAENGFTPEQFDTALKSTWGLVGAM